jgi:preprotein translocase SecE subunit
MSVTKTQTGRSGGDVGNKPPVAAPAGAGGGKLRDYFQSLQYEWRKITWPEKKQWKDSTIVVFIFVLVLMAVLASLDFSVGWFMNRLLGLNR